MIAVTAACLIYAVSGVDREALVAGFARADYRMIPLILLLLVVFYVLKAWRWALLLRPVKTLSAAQVTPAMTIGFMANNLLPAHLGEFVRVYVLGRQFGLAKTPVLATVVLERVFDILAILLLWGFSLLFVEGLSPEVLHLCRIVAILALCGVPVLLTYMIFTEWFVGVTSRVLGFFPFLPEKLRDGILNMLRAGADGLDSVRDVKLLVGISLSSIAQWMLNGAMIWAAMYAFDVNGSYYDALMVMGVIVFAILLPSPPGYFGVIQACFTLVLGERFSQEAALGCSVYYHMCQFVPVTLVGLVFLNYVGLNLTALKSEAAEQSADADTAESSPAEGTPSEA